MPKSKSKVKSKPKTGSRKPSKKSLSKKKKDDGYDSRDSECSDDDDCTDSEKAKRNSRGRGSKNWKSFPSDSCDDGEGGDENCNDSTDDSVRSKGHVRSGGGCCHCQEQQQQAGPSFQDQIARCICCRNKINFQLPCGLAAALRGFNRDCPFAGPHVQVSNHNVPMAVDPGPPGPACYPLKCKPTPYWEREIVKYNPDGKYDPKIEEKGETGWPNLFPDKESKKQKNKSRNEQSGKKKRCKKKDDEEQPVVIGEPCNAYRCYKDPCLPCGLAYCTPKHPRKRPLPPCPQKFPIKPRRICLGQLEEGEEPTPGQIEAAIATGLPPGAMGVVAFSQGFNNCGGNCPGVGNSGMAGSMSQGQVPGQMGQSCMGQGQMGLGQMWQRPISQGQGCMGQGQMGQRFGGQSPMAQGCMGRGMGQDQMGQPCGQNLGQGQFGQGGQSCPQVYEQTPYPNAAVNVNFSAKLPPSKKRKFPDEWIQVLPLCDPSKPPKSKKDKNSRKKSKGGGSSSNSKSQSDSSDGYDDG